MVHWCSWSFTNPQRPCALTDQGPFPMVCCRPAIAKRPSALEPLLQFSLADAPKNGVTDPPPPRLTVPSSETLVVDGPLLGFTQSAPSDAAGRTGALFAPQVN